MFQIWTRPLDDNKTAMVFRSGDTLYGAVGWFMSLNLDSRWGSWDPYHFGGFMPPPSTLQLTFHLEWWTEVGSVEEWEQSRGWEHPPQKIDSTPRLEDQTKRRLK